MSYEIHHVDSQQQKHSFSLSGIGLDAVCKSAASNISDTVLLLNLEVGSEMGYLWIDADYQGVLQELVAALSQLQASYIASEAEGCPIFDRSDYIGISHLIDSLMAPARGLGVLPDRRRNQEAESGPGE